MKRFFLLLIIFSLAVSVICHASPIFSGAAAVTSVDRTATFDGLTSFGIDLSTYSEDSLYVTVNGVSAQFANLFTPGDTRSTGYHYDSQGNFGYVSIRGTDGIDLTAVDFLLGDGVLGDNTLTLRWETYLNGGLTGSGTQNNLTKGQTVGWLDLAGFDELRVAGAPMIDPLPGFGNPQGIAIDDLRVQVVPEPATAGMLALSGLLIAAYRRIRKSYGC